MQLNRRNVAWILAGILFVLGSARIQYHVKVQMPRDDGTTTALGDLQVGSEAPDFSATDLQGRPVVLSEFRDRKVVVADFWAEWCGPCLMAMPDLQELHDEFEDRPLEILAVNLGESPEQIQRFMERTGYTFRVVPDQDDSIGHLFGVTAIPTMVVIGADGHVKRIRVGSGMGGKDRLKSILQDLIAEIQPTESDVL